MPSRLIHFLSFLFLNLFCLFAPSLSLSLSSVFSHQVCQCTIHGKFRTMVNFLFFIILLEQVTQERQRTINYRKIHSSQILRSIPEISLMISFCCIKLIGRYAKCFTNTHFIRYIEISRQSWEGGQRLMIV